MPNRRGWTLALTCAAIFMLVLDTTIVAVALSDMQRDLNASLASLQWVVDGYTLPLAAFLLPTASLGDRIGRRPLFMAGLAVFTVSSMACALAPTSAALGVFRAVQGLGGAALFGVAVPLIADVYPAGRARDLAIGVFGAFSGAAVAVGPLAGGVLTELFGWRAIFWLNVPIGGAALALSGWALARTGRGTRGPLKLDWAGMALCTSSLFLLVLGCIEGPSWGWAHPRTVTVFAGAALGCALFVLVELRVSDPMMDLRLFLAPHYTAGAAVGFVLQATLVASTTYLSLYVQNVLGFSALDTGLRFLPFSLAAFASAALVAPLLARVRAAWLVGGTAAGAALGLELIAFGPAAHYSELLPGFVVCGIALGTGTTVLNRVTVTGIAKDRVGAASGTGVALRQAGVTIGVAVLGIIYHYVAREQVRSELGALDDSAADLVADSVAAGSGTQAAAVVPPGPLRDTVTDAAARASVAGLDGVLHSGAALAALTALVAFTVLLRRPGHRVEEAAAEPTTASR
ncbi:MFS transporter [Streptomyces ipomoeae]|uniref:MFS transporter n=1 Tax=Streptomyces ipomoeae TaxID=103232 RepID=UPI0015F0B0A2|nr:MFS transporter [Streptomyces ipomoeae]MDX2939090.1 MFS transporter [Streptomyces ipomoeae]